MLVGDRDRVLTLSVFRRGTRTWAGRRGWTAWAPICTIPPFDLTFPASSSSLSVSTHSLSLCLSQFLPFARSLICFLDVRQLRRGDSIHDRCLRPIADSGDVGGKGRGQEHKDGDEK
jgi:hypothetical protein